MKKKKYPHRLDKLCEKACKQYLNGDGKDGWFPIAFFAGYRQATRDAKRGLIKIKK